MSKLNKKVKMPTNETLDGFQQRKIIEQSSQFQLMQTNQRYTVMFKADLKGIKQEEINYVVNY